MNYATTEQPKTATPYRSLNGTLLWLWSKLRLENLRGIQGETNELPHIEQRGRWDEEKNEESDNLSSRKLIRSKLWKSTAFVHWQQVRDWIVPMWKKHPVVASHCKTSRWILPECFPNQLYLVHIDFWEHKFDRDLLDINDIVELTFSTIYSHG